MANPQSLSQITPHYSKEVKELLRHIKENPDVQESLEKAAIARQNTKVQQAKKAALKVWYLFNAKPEDFHGTAYVTPELKNHSAITASIASASNLVDFFGNWPLLFFLFKSIGQGPAVVLSGVLNILILQIGNYCATATSGEKKGTKSWAQLATVSLILMNVVQTLASGVGVELLNNQNALSQLRAKELIAERTSMIEGLQALKSPDFENAQNQCQADKATLEEYKAAGSPAFDTLYVKTYGLYSERNRRWGEVPMNDQPTCVRARTLEERDLKPYNEAKELWKEAQADGALVGQVGLVRAAMPEIYIQEFTEDGLIRSGVVATRLATQNFFGKLSGGQFMDLGLSLYIFSISAITSLAACTLAVAHARREDTQMSRNQSVIRERDLYIQTLLDSMD